VKSDIDKLVRWHIESKNIRRYKSNISESVNYAIMSVPLQL
jgi:hypothetical protein